MTYMQEASPDYFPSVQENITNHFLLFQEIIDAFIDKCDEQQQLMVYKLYKLKIRYNGQVR